MAEGLEVQSDSDTIIRMLYFCERPRTTTQIMYYCSIDRARVRKFTDHCLKRKLLRQAGVEYDQETFALTEHGSKTLATAIDIMKELDMDPSEVLNSPSKR